LKNVKIFVIFPRLSEVNPDRFPKDLGGNPEETGRNTQFFGNFGIFEPKTAIFPNQKETNPEFSGSFLESIRNAPEVKCRKIASLPRCAY
jgi:hypothetical protein